MILEIILFLLLLVESIRAYIAYLALPKEERAGIEAPIIRRESELMKWQPPKSEEDLIGEKANKLFEI